MNKLIAVGVGILLLVLLLLFSTTYTVKYNEVAVRATFGQAGEDSVVHEPGLHFRWPVFIDDITKLDRRLQLVETPLQEISTSDGLQVVVKAYLLWQVAADDGGAGPLEFYRQYETISDASLALRSQFRTTTTGQLSQFAFNDLIGEESRLADAEEAIRRSMAERVADSGVRPVAVGVSQIVLPAATSQAVLQRMRATRTALAEVETIKGSAEKDRIESEASTIAEKIEAFARQRAEEIRAEGEVQAAKYYEQLGQDEDLAVFLVWLDALRQVLNENTTVILETEFAPFHLMGGEPTGQGAIPRPRMNIMGGGESAQSSPDGGSGEAGRSSAAMGDGADGAGSDEQEQG